jgi:hypothetical protein
MKVQNLNNINDVQKFINELVNEPPYYLGLAFHIDTPFSDYINFKSEPIFNKNEALRLQIMLERCLDICDIEEVDIYAITLEVMENTIF